MPTYLGQLLHQHSSIYPPFNAYPQALKTDCESILTGDVESVFGKDDEVASSRTSASASLSTVSGSGSNPVLLEIYLEFILIVSIPLPILENVTAASFLQDFCFYATTCARRQTRRKIGSTRTRCRRHLCGVTLSFIIITTTFISFQQLRPKFSTVYPFRFRRETSSTDRFTFQTSW